MTTVLRMTQISGEVAAGFGPVADAFARNFDEHGELGAAFSLYVDGEIRADLWAGVADKQFDRPWAQDTLQLDFSTTKGGAAICIPRLVDAGGRSAGTSPTKSPLRSGWISGSGCPSRRSRGSRPSKRCRRRACL